MSSHKRIVLTALPGVLYTTEAEVLRAWEDGQAFKCYLKQLTGTKEEFLAMGYDRFTFLFNRHTKTLFWKQ